MDCGNCGEKMVEEYKVKIHHTSLLAYISLVGKNDEKKIKAYVCPKCGKIEFYTE